MQIQLAAAFAAKLQGHASCACIPRRCRCSVQGKPLHTTIMMWQSTELVLVTAIDEQKLKRGSLVAM
jgi:hypothetical protein